MRFGPDKSIWRSHARSLIYLLLLCPLGGCASERHQVEKNLMIDKDQLRHHGVADNYLVGFPDVLDFEVADHPEFDGRAAVGADGRVSLRNGLSVRVEGRNVADIAKALADLTGIPVAKIKVRVADFKSQQLLLMGQVVGWQRTVPYHGQETVLDVLQRVGGITPGAAPDDVYVVRTHLVDGQRPEVFHVDLDSIVMKKDTNTNIRVMPNDQIHVGETRQARFVKCFPKWLQPLCHALCGTRPSTKDGKGMSIRDEAASLLPPATALAERRVFRRAVTGTDQPGESRPFEGSLTLTLPPADQARQLSEMRR